eukprot:6449641-Amphidinium_carterae.1
MRAREKDNSADARLEMLLQQTKTELPPPQLQDATYRSPSHPPTGPQSLLMMMGMTLALTCRRSPIWHPLACLCLMALPVLAR